MAAGDVDVDVNSVDARHGAWFDGSDDRVVIADSTPMRFAEAGESFTVSFWMKPHATQNASADVCGTETSIGSVKGWVVRTGSPYGLFVNDGSGSTQTNFGSSTVHRWNHLTFVIDRDLDEARTYTNGALSNTSSITGDGSYEADTGMEIGVSNFDDVTNRNYTGVIGDFRVHNVALTAEEITDLFGGKRITRGLIHEWLLKDDYTDTVGSDDGTNTGSFLGIHEAVVSKALQARRVTANDIYLSYESAGNQTATIHIEEA